MTTPNAQTKWVQNFQGFSDSSSPGASPQLTNDLRDVLIKFGQVRPRGGVSKYGSISTASSAAIIDLMSYPRVSGTNSILRMLPTKVEHLTGGAWADITGTALSGSVTTRPQYTIIDDTLVFVNEGANLPRKWDGTGNTTSIASGTSPYAKGVASYLGFLFLLNVSDSGTFSDVVDGHRILRYSDDWDNDWSLCNGNEIVLWETPGSVIRALVMGRDLMCYKEDGAVRLTWIGGNIVFKQEKLDWEGGWISPLALRRVTDDMHVGLSTEGVICVITQNEVRPVSFDQLARTLNTSSILALSKLKFARSFSSDLDANYFLFYDRTGLSNQLLDSWVSYNYRTKVISKGRLGVQAIAAEAHRPTVNSEQDLLLSTTTLVEEFESASDDDGSVITSYWTTGPQSLGEEGWMIGARLIFEVPSGKNAHAEVSVSVNESTSFQFPIVFKISPDDPSDDFVEVLYSPPPVFGSWFNVKVRFLSNAINSGVELRRVGLIPAPTHSIRTSAPNVPAALSA